MTIHLLNELKKEYDRDEFHSVVLFGSHARNEPGAFSDFDIACFLKYEKHSYPFRKLLILQEKLISVDFITPLQFQARLQRPELIVVYLKGLLTAIPLIDRENYFQNQQTFAQNFVWTNEVQAKADLWAEKQLVLLTEYVHKALQALSSENDIGRMFFVRQNLPLELLRIIQVKFGILTDSDNKIPAEVLKFLREKGQIDWIQAFENSIGITPLPLNSQVAHSLKLFAETANLIKDTFSAENADIFEHSLSLIATQFNSENIDFESSNC